MLLQASASNAEVFAGAQILHVDGPAGDDDHRRPSLIVLGPGSGMVPQTTTMA